jgi:hypothetical protein
VQPVRHGSGMASWWGLDRVLAPNQPQGLTGICRDRPGRARGGCHCLEETHWSLGDNVMVALWQFSFDGREAWQGCAREWGK